jgi:hypothetical protein
MAQREISDDISSLPLDSPDKSFFRDFLLTDFAITWLKATDSFSIEAAEFPCFAAWIRIGPNVPMKRLKSRTP